MKYLKSCKRQENSKRVHWTWCMHQVHSAKIERCYSISQFSWRGFAKRCTETRLRLFRTLRRRKTTRYNGRSIFNSPQYEGAHWPDLVLIYKMHLAMIEQMRSIIKSFKRAGKFKAGTLLKSWTNVSYFPGRGFPKRFTKPHLLLFQTLRLRRLTNNKSRPCFHHSNHPF